MVPDPVCTAMQVHSLAVHPSRPDLVACGGTGGAVGVWDLRWTTQPLLCALPEGGKEDVWEVGAASSMCMRMNGCRGLEAMQWGGILP